MSLQTIWATHRCGPPKQSFAAASRQAARSVSRNFATSVGADRFGNQPNPQYGLARGVEQLHAPLAVLRQAACDPAEEIGADPPHLAPFRLMALEFHSLDRGASIAAVTDAEEILRHGRTLGSGPRRGPGLKLPRDLLPSPEDCSPYNYDRNVPIPELQSVGRAAQLGHTLGLGRRRFRLHRLKLRAIHRRRRNASGDFRTRIGRAGFGGVQRARPRHRAGHQHLLAAALMAEIAISEAHAGDRAAKTAFVALVEIEAGLERNALDRRTHGLAADLQRIARQTDVANGARARELDRAGGAHIVEDAASAAGAVETGKGEHLAGNEPARFVCRHHPSECRCNHCSGRDSSQRNTSKHLTNSNFTIAAGRKSL